MQQQTIVLQRTENTTLQHAILNSSRKLKLLTFCSHQGCWFSILFHNTTVNQKTWYSFWPVVIALFLANCVFSAHFRQLSSSIYIQVKCFGKTINFLTSKFTDYQLHVTASFISLLSTLIIYIYYKFLLLYSLGNHSGNPLVGFYKCKNILY